MPSAWGLVPPPPGAHILFIAEEAPAHQAAGDGGKGETSGMLPLHSSASFFEKGPKKFGVFITYKLISPSCEVPVEWMLRCCGYSETRFPSFRACRKQPSGQAGMCRCPACSHACVEQVGRWEVWSGLAPRKDAVTSAPVAPAGVVCLSLHLPSWSFGTYS